MSMILAKISRGKETRTGTNRANVQTGMKHRNLVNLKGCCIREQQRLLVYEYVDNYDIDKALLGELNS